MGTLMEFPLFDPDLRSLTREELLSRLDGLRATLRRLDEEEPADMESDEYTDWGDAHEELEDQIDEILDRLDELG